MAFSLVTSIQQAGGIASNTTTGIDTTGADLIVVFVNYYSNYFGSFSLSDSNGNTWTSLTGTDPAGQAGCRFYYCLSPTVGSGHTFTQAGFAYHSMAVMAFSGANTAGAVDQQNGASTAGASSLATGSVTPTEDNELVIYGCAGGTIAAGHDITAVDVGTLQHHVASATNTYAQAVGYQIQTTATARNPSFTCSASAKFSARIATFKAATAGGVSGTIGQVTETDSAFATTALRAMAIGLSSETDDPQGIAALRTHGIGLSSEADTAQDMTALRAEAIGLCTETDTAQVFTALRAESVGLSSESDSAFSMAYSRRLEVGIAQESDSAMAFSAGLTSSLGIATEADSAFGMTGRRTTAVSIALEADTAQAMTASRIVLVGIGTEADSAFAAAHAKRRDIVQAIETDAAQSVLVLRVPLMGLALETDTAFSFTAPSNGTLLIGAKVMAGGQQTVILLKGAGSIH